MVNSELKEYVEREILPRYDNFDAAHRRDHAERVIAESLRLAVANGADLDMAYTIAAYHDTGLAVGRAEHHTASRQIILEDTTLRRWFSEKDIAIMADAAEDHRASSKCAPRTIYGRIVAEADRFIDPEDVMRRTIQYSLEHHPSLNREEGYDRLVEHMHEKYYYGGYLKLWFEESENARRLEELRQLIADKPALRERYDRLYDEITAK